MIVTSIDDCTRYSALHPLFARVFAWIRSADFGSLPAGKLVLDGDNLYCMVSAYRTKPESAAVWEAHRKYIDIQIVTSGRERLGTASLPSLKEKNAYDEPKDFHELEGEAEQAVLLFPGEMAILFPEDAHCPGMHPDGITENSVSKVVVKIRVQVPNL